MTKCQFTQVKKVCDGEKLCPKCDKHCGCVCGKWNRDQKSEPKSFACCFCHFIGEGK